MTRRSDPLSVAVVLRAFSVLRQHLKQPEIGNIDSYVQSYIEACPGASGSAFSAAVDHYLRTTERAYWPLPGTLAKLCREAESALAEADPSLAAYHAWSRSPWASPDVTGEKSAPCPICGACWVWQPWYRSDGTLTPPILTIRHDRPPHLSANVRYFDAPGMTDWRPISLSPEST